MLHWLTSLIGAGRAGQASASEKLSCFHCGDRMKRRHAVHVQFGGAARVVCCHGCASILETVEQMGKVRQYCEQKGQADVTNDK